MKSGFRLPWLSLLIPAGYLPGYFFGSRPGLLETIAILVATAVAFALTDRLGRMQEGPRAAPPPQPKNAPPTSGLGAFNPFSAGPGGPEPQRPRARAADPAPVAPPARRGLPGWVLAIGWPLALTAGALLFASLIAGASLDRVAALGRKEAWSVGIFQQALWWTGHGVPLGVTYATTDGSLHRQFAIHFSPLLALLQPLYERAPSASTLLWAQALALGLAALPLYAAARTRTDRMGAGLLSVAWLLHPTIVGSPLTGFHDLAFMPFFAFTALWALLRRRPLFFLIAILALMALREDLAFFVILFSIPAWWVGNRRGYAFAALLFGGFWFLAAITWIMPHFRTPELLASPQIFFNQYLGSWGSTPAAVIAHVLAHPMDLVHRVVNRDTALYLLALTRPVGLLVPLPDPMWISGLQNFGLNIVGEGNVLKSPLARYSIPAVTALFMALPGALAFWGRRFGAPERLVGPAGPRGSIEERGAAVRAEARLGDLWNARDREKGSGPRFIDGQAGAPVAAIVVVAALLSLSVMRIDRQFTTTPRSDLAAQMQVLAAVPDTVSVLAPDYAFARLANRARYACIGSLEERALEPAVLERFDAVLVDLAPESFEAARYPELLPKLYEHLRTSRDYRETASANNIHLFVHTRVLSALPEGSTGR